MATVLLTSTTFQIGTTHLSWYAWFKVIVKVEKNKFESSFSLETLEIDTLTEIAFWTPEVSLDVFKG